MFLKENRFKRLCKEAYKGSELDIALTENGTFAVSSGWWYVEAPSECITKEILGILIGITEELPRTGHAYRFRENFEPVEIPVEAVCKDLWEKTLECEDIYHKSRITYMGMKEKRRILLGKMSAVAVENDIIKMIDWKKTEDGEVLSDKIYRWGNLLIWESTNMDFGVRKADPADKEEEEFLELCGNIKTE